MKFLMVVGGGVTVTCVNLVRRWGHCGLLRSPFRIGRGRRQVPREFGIRNDS